MLRMFLRRFSRWPCALSAAHSRSQRRRRVGSVDSTAPKAPITAAATLKQDGEKVTGSIESPQGTAEMNGTLKGKALNISFTHRGPERDRLISR